MRSKFPKYCSLFKLQRRPNQLCGGGKIEKVRGTFSTYLVGVLPHSLFSDVTDDGRSHLTERIGYDKIIDDLNFKGIKERPCLTLIIF